MNLRVGVVGASGFSGAVATAILAGHPRASLVFATSDKLAGQRVANHVSAPLDALTYVANADALARAASCDVVFLCTSAEVSATLAPALLAAGTKVIDLSGAFRLARAEDYPRWYGFPHPAPALLAEAHYGLPELGGAPPKGTRLIANPGCYPTASLLALVPLVRAGLVEATGLIIDAKSGVTGAGRQTREELSFAELDGDHRAYKLLVHQHVPEITRALSENVDARLTFTPHLLPVRRGLLATCYARPRSGATAARVRECLADAYAGAAFVRVVAPEEVRIAAVAGTNHALVAATANDDVVIAIAAIDNLTKGAAGQAVQNMNLLFDLPETTGLAHLARVSP